MSQSDDRRDRTLPITAEVGSEGGSYADPTLQVPTFNDDIRRSRHIDTAVHDVTELASEGTAGHADSGMLRYPTEPPSRPGTTSGWGAGSINWRSAVMGAAAGVALAYGIGRLRTSRNRADRGPGGSGSGVSDE